MIHPLTLGNSTFQNNIIQGPLAGISCAPFRYLTWKYGKPAFSCTEMISCKTIIHQPLSSLKRFILKDPNEGPVCFQLSGTDPAEVAEATKRVTDFGANLIDLNCGCPVKKIRSRGAGSSLLTNPKKLFDLIRAMKDNTHVPVSIKIRVEKDEEKFNADIVNVVKDAGPDFIIVHGRHWTEHYETPCRYEEIAYFVNELSIPVIGNGDVACADSLKKMLSTGCAGAMIARAGVGQPWLAAKLIADMRGESFTLPDSAAIGAIFLDHTQQLTQLLGNEKFAILQARKFAKYYARHLPDRSAFCDEVNLSDSLSDFERICQRYFI